MTYSEKLAALSIEGSFAQREMPPEVPWNPGALKQPSDRHKPIGERPTPPAEDFSHLNTPQWRKTQANARAWWRDMTSEERDEARRVRAENARKLKRERNVLRPKP